MKNTITRTVTKTTIDFMGFSYKDDSLFNAQWSGYEMTEQDLTIDAETKNNCKVLKITGVTTSKFKLTIDLQTAIENGTLEEIE